jgi:acyl-CoA-dependent ceramide synthase
MFMVVWIAARHVAYLMVCFSLWRDLPAETVYGCYKGTKATLTGPFSPEDRFWHLIEPFYDPQGVVCFNHNLKWGFLTGLLMLQAIMIMWFRMICKVAIRMLQGGEANDSRSDDEEDEKEDGEPMVIEKFLPMTDSPLEEEVGVEAINLKRHKNTTKGKKSTSSNSGIDRKELLGRIGCDKGT